MKTIDQVRNISINNSQFDKPESTTFIGAMASTLPAVNKMTEVLGGDGIDEENYDKIIQNNNNSLNINHNVILDNVPKIPKLNGHYKYEGKAEHTAAKGTVLQEFYNGTNVFITGATGFLGKMLLYKLFRSCPGIENIYILVRQKKGKDVHSRVEEIFDDPVFDVLKQEVPKFRHKIVIVPGDISFAGLGLSLSDRQMLTEKVNIVIHAAATVRFDEKLKLALAINVHGVKSLLDLCKSMSKLKSLVHVSTAYSNCYRKEIGEKFYKYPTKLEEVEKLVGKLDDKDLDDIVPTLLGTWPNTYTFTKALAEDYVRENSRGLPIGIFRPGIVTSTYQEPMVGWIDNLYGPTGVVAGAGTGLLRTLHCDGNMNANIVPVDMCVNALIASAWDIANNCNERKEENMLIYNYVSSVENPLSWNQFMKLNESYGFDYPFASAIWYYCFTLNKYAFMNKLYTALLHIVPALLVDGLALCIGQKPRVLKMYKKVHKFAEVISYFCTNEWDFSNDNVQGLWIKLNAKDKQIFPFSMKSVDWVHYFTYYLRGMGTYLFKEDCDVIEARKRWNRFYVLHVLLKTTIVASSSYALWSMISRLFFS